MKKKLGFLLLSSLMLFSMSSAVFASDSSISNTGDKIITTSYPEEYKIETLTKEEFYADLAKATNRTIEQVRKEEEQKNQSFADQTFYYSRMSKTIDLGKGVKAEYGVDTKQERIMFGGAAGRRIVEVYKDTAYLKAATSGGYTIEKDFVNPVLEDEHNLVLRASGTSVVATTKGYNSSLNVSVEALLGIGYSLGETIENTKYYRKNFEETARFKVS